MTQDGSNQPVAAASQPDDASGPNHPAKSIAASGVNTSLMRLAIEVETT